MAQKLSEIIFNSISDGVFTVNRECIITSFNKAAEEITGFKSDEAVGKHCYDIFRTEICNKKCALKDTLKSHATIENARVTIITRDGCEIPISVSTTMLKDGNGEIIGAVEFFRDISEIDYLEKSLERKQALRDIVSVNDKMQKLIGLLPDIADSDCSVLIEGPSGCGKELFAQILHNLSPRKYGPYIKINCAALPANLLESELFGYEKGAFTDAKRDKPGQFCLANGGTLLLDEISEMDVALQVKLLRVLNNGEYRPLGSTKAMRTDARVIAATNAELASEIEKGRFRKDLYYRINVVNIKIPALSERPEDIPLLVNHFIQVFKDKTRRPIKRVTPEAMVMLRNYSFPGNVRELENAIEHAFVMCHGEEIKPSHLPQNILEDHVESNGISPVSSSEKKIIQEALQRNHGNKTLTARELGVHRSTLWRKIKTYGIRV
ncbi:MAG TPA: PAS domain-containing protein [candidate division Zixibacteria bacterium]|nr:PAS domain-containing protein [candidate division Zixibacteria bacterium]